MEKIAISKLVDFRRKSSPSTKKTFVQNLEKIKPEDDDSSGGDYWITSISAIANIFKKKDKSFLDYKIEELKAKVEASDHNPTKIQFQRNIEILYKMHDLDFDAITPPATLQLLKKPRLKSIIDLYGLPIRIRPHHIFSYLIGEYMQVGGVLFVAKLGGYTDGELGMFSSGLYHYLNKCYANQYQIDPEYCRAIDVSSIKEVKHTQILKGDIPDLLEKTIEELRSFRWS